MSAGEAAGRTRVLVLFGGRSSEHEVSCLSARNVLGAIDRERYVVTTVGITRDGRWTLLDGVPDTPPGVLPAVPDDGPTVALVRTRKGPVLLRYDEGGGAAEDLGPVDVCFPVLHGPYGEDGTVQGLLASHGVPYVGADVASSAVGVDKRQMKNVFKARGLPQVAHLAVRRTVWDTDRGPVLDDVETTLRYPVFTKPARQGSSIGIRKCASREELIAGIEEAFGYDRVAIVEEGLDGVRELECGVIGNSQIEVTRPGETVHVGEAFYDFDAKYLKPVELRCPADLPEHVQRRCMDFAREAYLAIGCRGMARVDFFYDERNPDPAGQLLINEINTIPGLTPSSMFPPVWAAEGVGFGELIDRLLSLALSASRAEAHYAP
ncbi:MAG TPA: D-alanine--D-alanine ligase family protein [Egibacteraceae bacterium]|nr:D-alanine--D-alanine ligase family protein [Egibacteraceae bacterium]